MRPLSLAWVLFVTHVCALVPAAAWAIWWGPLDSPWKLFALGLLTAAMLGIASVVASRRIRASLEPMARAVDRLAQGELNHRIMGVDLEPIHQLAGAMNRMAQQLDDRFYRILSQQNEQEAMLTSMEEGVLAVDKDGRIINVNHTCAQLLGAEESRLRGRLVHEVIRKPDLLAMVEQILQDQSPAECDLRILGPEDVWLHAHGSPLYDARRRQIGALMVLHDVTRLRRLENVRRDFVANVSHELRTPITSIKGFVETLLDGALDDRDTSGRFLRIVLRQVNRLNAIIEDLLILSRIERGSEEATIEVGEDSVADVLRAAVEMCEKQAADKGVRVACICDETLAARVNAHLLEQAVVNLVGNAVKYSDSGATVEVSATRSNGEVVIAVKDHGCGIEPRHLPRLFERFYRVDKARSRELGGTGLGLAIVKHIALAHRGSVGVESTLGEGSTFTIRLPAPDDDAPPEKEVAAGPGVSADNPS